MTKFSLQDKMCILISGALMLMMCSEAQQEFFPQLRNLTWDEARNHCQVCFKELVTPTPGNIQIIAKNLTSDSWIGLRKYLHPSSLPWSRWANGDPLTFQNWYPGWPVLKSHFPQTNCSCSEGQTPELFESTTESITNFSDLTTLEYMSSSMMFPNFTETEEDSCVVMLRFGPWVEKSCSELLPFICYDDRLSGRANVTDVTTSSATLTWLPVPGGISHYRVEVRGDVQLTEIHNPTSDLTSNLSSLTAGTRYSIQVFPVKCERDLNPQIATFYTKPDKVQNLTVAMVTETSVFLSWNKPSGHVDFYLVAVHGANSSTDTESSEVGDLIPGSSYTFTVLSGLHNSMLSEGSHITTFTKPHKVSNLSVSENTNTSLRLSWRPPEGNSTAFRVQARNDNNNELFDEVVQRDWTQTQQEKRVTRLPEGTKITLSVAVIANGTVEGDKVTIVNYTAPGPISHLYLETTDRSLTANWTGPAGNYSSFNITLKLEGQDVDATADVTEPVKEFVQLKTAAKYTVIVRSVSGHLQSPPVESSKFTKPLPPTSATVVSTSKTQLTFQWTGPDNAAAPRYLVNLNSSFWGHRQSFSLSNKTIHTFENLTSGTKYQFQVQTATDEVLSVPLIISSFTEAEERQISLSMLCSSSQPLLCAKDATEESVFSQLEAYYKNLLGDNVFWKLEKQESENTIS
nr:PREDICTED: receptor-type tyrosine-protein phosphatase eta-like [Paralichthys olivaceus]